MASVDMDGYSEQIRPSTSAPVEIGLAPQNTLRTCSVHRGPIQLWSAKK